MNTNIFKEHALRFRWMLMALLCCCVVGCSDDDDQAAVSPYDPSKPVTVTDFSPKSAAYGEDIVIYGTNFGNDVSRVKVTIGGKNARVIGVKNTIMYCVVPQGAYGNEIQVEITDGGENILASAVCESAEFSYARSWLVTTEIGTHYETSNDEMEIDGPFKECGTISEGWWFSWDPKSNFDVLYMTTDKQFYRKLDFGHDNGDGTFGYASTVTTPFARMLAMDWTAASDTQHDRDMIYAENHSSDSKVAIYLWTRSSDFLESQLLGGAARGVNSLLTHLNGELYYSRYRAGDVWRYDYATNTAEQVFILPHAGLSSFMVMHPTGNYAYILMKEKHYIMRTDYDWENQTFTTPYVICGDGGGASGYADGVGTRARFNQPIQGVFVKNQEYVDMGESDEYDFYFTDKENHCIRILTPTGRVTTWAGRSNSTDKGFNDGDLRTQALFNGPSAITYDEKRQCFYVADRSNKVIRTIRLEQNTDTQPAGEEDGDEATGDESGETTTEE